jgi:glucose-fructose oxidoreductase
VTVDEPKAGRRGAIDYMVERIRRDLPVEGPLSPAMALVGQRILDTALAASQQKKTLALLP